MTLGCPSCGSLITGTHFTHCKFVVNDRYFEQLRIANEWARKSHERAIACGAEWDGMDGYTCPRTDGTCECFKIELPEREKP